MNEDFYARLRPDWERPFSSINNKGFLLVSDMTLAEAEVAVKQQLCAHGLPIDSFEFLGIMDYYRLREKGSYISFMAACYDTPYGPEDFTIVILSRDVMQHLGAPQWLETWTHPHERVLNRVMLQNE